jgi:hypothetical protein
MSAGTPPNHQQRAAHLRTLLDRWIAEHPRILAIDPVRAHHHAEAIDDLRSMIAQLDAPAAAQSGKVSTQLAEAMSIQATV